MSDLKLPNLSRKSAVACGVSFFLLFLLVTISCYSAREGIAWGKGRALSINVSNMALVPEAIYTVDQTNYVIRPKESNARLAVLKVYIRNDRSSKISMLVDENAAFITDRRSNRLGSLDPYKNREETQKVPEDGVSYLPLLWGTTSVLKGYEIQGWMFFEVPEDFIPERFNWEQGESMWVTVKDIY